MQTHLALRTLKGMNTPDKDVQVMFAIRPNRKALLFIHGYSGDPITTWSDFHELLPENPRFRDQDIFFYGYDGLRACMYGSAAIFRSFLERVFQTTQTFLLKNLPPSARRANDFKYDELIIVAHSLGAVISRRAILDATRNNSSWVSRIKLVLYAPAHKGARVADLAMEIASSFPFLKFFGIFTRFQSPLIDQLKPESSALRSLLEDTMGARKDGANPHLDARKVIVAQYERIVDNATFAFDPPPDTIPETTHTSICKPRKDFLDPIRCLESCL